jgi:hypothetical protein
VAPLELFGDYEDGQEFGKLGTSDFDLIILREGKMMLFEKPRWAEMDVHDSVFGA